MLPYINIFGYEIATYGLIIFIGIFIGAIISIFYFSKFFSVKKEDIFYCILYAVIGLGIGAKLLYYNQHSIPNRKLSISRFI